MGTGRRERWTGSSTPSSQSLCTQVATAALGSTATEKQFLLHSCGGESLSSYPKCIPTLPPLYVVHGSSHHFSQATAPEEKSKKLQCNLSSSLIAIYPPVWGPMRRHYGKLGTQYDLQDCRTCTFIITEDGAQMLDPSYSSEGPWTSYSFESPATFISLKPTSNVSSTYCFLYESIIVFLFHTNPLLQMKQKCFSYKCCGGSVGWDALQQNHMVLESRTSTRGSQFSRSMVNEEFIFILEHSAWGCKSNNQLIISN